MDRSKIKMADRDHVDEVDEEEEDVDLVRVSSSSGSSSSDSSSDEDAPLTRKVSRISGLSFLFRRLEMLLKMRLSL